MRIKKCRSCKKNNLKKLFSLGDMCFTGKFPSKNQKIECELWVATKLKNGWLQGTQVHPMFFQQNTCLHHRFAVIFFLFAKGLNHQLTLHELNFQQCLRSLKIHDTTLDLSLKT